MKVAALILASVALAIAEPPVPSNRYLPGSFSSPSRQYVPQSSFNSLSSNYGAPSGLSSYAGSSFGHTQAVIAPNMQYGAPRVSSQYGAPGYAAGGNGYANGDQSEPANYNFEYNVQDAEHGNDYGHQETRHEDNAEGAYSVLLPDGRRQTVQYSADASGFKPKITYEQVSKGYGGGYSNGGYSNGGYANGGYSNGGYSNGGYSNGGSSNGGYSTGAYANGGVNGASSNGAYATGGYNGGYSGAANGGAQGYQY